VSQGLGKAFSLALAAQMQIIGLLVTGWLLGQWLNKEYPIEISWYFITFPICVVAMIHTLYKMYIFIKKKT
jgi:hypothetical protein